MKITKQISISSLLILLLICSLSSQYDDSSKRLLIISLDGFRHQYLTEHTLDNLNQFANEGVKTRNGMEPTYTTMTFPNHISIATGMFQEDHGVVHNTFFDRLLNRSIGMGSRDDGQWSDPKVEPIWITATRQGKNAAVLFWPACHNEFNGVRPLIYSTVYTDAVPFREKINNAINYFLRLPMHLVMLYHFEPDKQGHDYGPNSPEVAATLVRLDGDIKYLMDRVKNELNDSVNILILSDHGMTYVNKTTRPLAEGFVNRSSIDPNILGGSLFNVLSREGQTEQVINDLRRIPNVTVYKREEMPKRFHYSKPVHRLGDVFVLPNTEGHSFSSATSGTGNAVTGNHGWDNTLPSMQAIFMARGPAFATNHQIHSLKNVDVYHIVCQILGLTPNTYATAGSLANLTSIFRSYENSSTSSWVPPTSATVSAIGTTSAPGTGSTTRSTSATGSTTATTEARTNASVIFLSTSWILLILSLIVTH